jgi:hypothetical protein
MLRLGPCQPVIPVSMAEANRLRSALDDANCQLAREIAVSPVQGHSLQLSCICTSVAAALPRHSGETSPYGASAASFLESNVVYQLASFLGGTLRALGDCMLLSASDMVQVTWRLALAFLKDLVADCTEALQRSWLTQLLDAGMEICYRSHQGFTCQGLIALCLVRSAGPLCLAGSCDL